MWMVARLFDFVFTLVCTQVGGHSLSCLCWEVGVMDVLGVKASHLNLSGTPGGIDEKIQ